MENIPLERYVAGVLEKEVSGDWPVEVLKAQAVATRTYALYRKAHPRDANYDLLTDTRDQVFEKKSHHSLAIVQAIQETAGEVLQSEGEIFEAFFHSCCGGMSERADHIWSGTETPPLLKIHEDPFCEACPYLHWDFEIGREELKQALQREGYSLGEEWTVQEVEKASSGRVVQITFHSREGVVTIPGTELRKIIGYTNLKSTLFDLVDFGEQFLFTGKGYGHGVGLCQWGAKGMAELGMGYQQILLFYYPGADIVKQASDE